VTTALEEQTVGILPGRKQQKDLRLALQAMRKRGIVVNGPYRRRNGKFVLSIAKHVITETELLGLERSRKFEPNELENLLTEMEKRRT
jgi:hypothetical protein